MVDPISRRESSCRMVLMVRKCSVCGGGLLGHRLNIWESARVYLELGLKLLFGSRQPSIFAFDSDKGFLCDFGEIDAPALGNKVEDPQSSTCAEPAFGDLVEMVQTVLNVSLGGLVG